MNKEKQIEEMVRIMNECCNVYDEQGRHIRNKCSDCEEWSDDNNCCCSYNRKEAEALYNAGYRKASEIFLELISEIDNSLYDMAVEYHRAGHPVYFAVCEMVHHKVIAPIEKKYTKSENFNGKTE